MVANGAATPQDCGRRGHQESEPVTNRRNEQARAANALERYVDELIENDVFKSRRAVALACGMKDAPFSRAVNHEKDDGRRRARTLSMEQCFRLALAANDDPATVLRAAGRHEAAKMVSALWPAGYAFTRREREHLKLWRLTTVGERHQMEGIILLLVKTRAARSDGSRKTVRRARARSPRERS
jgi:hypothetical protein